MSRVTLRCRTRTVPRGLRADVRTFLEWYEDEHGLPEPLVVTLFPHPYMSVDAQHPGYIIEADILEGNRRTPHDVRVAVDGVDTDTALTRLAHEIVHYEQSCQGRALTERGVNVRARSLVQRWRNACGRSD